MTGPLESQRGSALLLALFVVIVLTSLGTALLFLSQSEIRMSQASLRHKQAFFLAESGLEDGRMTLFAANPGGTIEFDDDLTAAAGPDGILDFNPAALTVAYDNDGQVTGISGFGDDVPLRALTELPGGGWYAAFLTNDPVDAIDSLDDDNDRVMVTAIGAGPDRSMEIVQAIVEPTFALPPIPPAAITMLGPDPEFDNGNSNAQSHTGNDCGLSGGLYAPIVGTTSGGAADAVQDGMNRPDHFSSGPQPFVGHDTVANLLDPFAPIVDASGVGTMDLAWTDCNNLRSLVLDLAASANYYCNTDVSSCSLPTTTASSIVVIDGDFSTSGFNRGVLVVTGQLTYNGNSGWEGIILAIGEGRIRRNGGGGGNPSGGVIMANIDPTPDGVRIDKTDWCSRAPDGFGPASYETNGGGNSTVEWCTTNIDASNAARNYRVMEFAQF